LAEEKPTRSPVRVQDAETDDYAPVDPEARAEQTDEWPEVNPAGIARMKQSQGSFRRGETAPPGERKSPSVGVSFSNPTPPSVPAVGSRPPTRLDPQEVSGPLPLMEEPDPEEAGFLDPFGGNPEWSGWTKKLDVEAQEAAAPATDWSLQSVDLDVAKRAGKAEPLVTLGEGEEPTGKSEVTGPRIHGRAEERKKEDEEAAAEAGPPPREPRNYSQFVAVIIILVILNVPAILVLHRYMTSGTSEIVVEEVTERTLTPEDLAVITDEMWARPGQAAAVLIEWDMTPEEYSRLMAQVNTDPELSDRYSRARRTGPRGERKVELGTPSAGPGPEEPAVGGDEDPS